MSQPVPRREIFAWGMYDFANSAFATSILAVIFAKYFTNEVVPMEGFPLFGRVWSGEALWNYAGAISMGAVCVTAPFIGAITDYTAAKKRLLTVYWFVGCLATAFLYMVHPGMVIPAVALFIIGNMGFAGGNALYNAFLTELAPPDKMGRVSAFGWGLGYVGGGLCLLVNLWMFQKWGTRAIGPIFLVVGAWWFLFAMPLFFMVKERAIPKPLPPGQSYVSAGFSDVIRTLKDIRKYRELFKFLIAYLLFNEGVETVIFNAAVFGGKVVGMKSEQLIVCYLAIQGVAVVGALAFGQLADRFRCKPTLILSLFVWMGVLLFAFSTTTIRSFWILGILVGLVMGGTQSISRAFFGQLAPKEKSAEFFGFFAIGGKFAAALGPLVFGTITEATGHMKWGIISIGVFFIAGLLILLTVNETRGRAEAANA